jgi:DHA1 family inner membrane transport protein
MLVFALGNLGCALASDYRLLMAARVLTALAHGTFFGVGIVVATGLVPHGRKASAVSSMFGGMAMATLLGVPAGAWLGLHVGWHAPFWAMAALGVAASVALARLVPPDARARPTVSARGELSAVVRPRVLLGLATTVMGCAGLSTAFTYIDPILTRIAGFGHAAVSPLLLLCGAGMVTGNAIGGRLANRHLLPALVGGLAIFTAVLGAMGVVMHDKAAAVLFTGLFGIVSFSLASPMQLWVLRLAGCAESLASSLNISAINLGNALGAWIGGTVLEGPGLGFVCWAAMLTTSCALAASLCGAVLERRSRSVGLAACRPARCCAET